MAAEFFKRRTADVILWPEPNDNSISFEEKSATENFRNRFPVLTSISSHNATREIKIYAPRSALFMIKSNARGSLLLGQIILRKH